MVNIIVAVGKDGAIGRDGDLIWRIREDLRRFKTLTMGHTVVMGRKTWDSLPRRPLPGRRNIVVSRNPEFAAPGAEVAPSPEEALRMAAGEDVFIMGGAHIYNAFLPFATDLTLTEIDAACPDADTWFPFPPDSEIWEKTEETDTAATEDGVEYKYVSYVRK